MGLLTTKNEDTFLCGNKFKISSSIQSNQTSWDQITKFAQRNSMKDTSSLWTIKPGLMFVCRMSPLYSNIVDCTRVWGQYFFDHLSGKCTIPHRIPSLQKKVGFLQYYVWRVRSSTWLIFGSTMRCTYFYVSLKRGCDRQTWGKPTTFLLA